MSGTVARVKLVVSDVDGTLLTDDKRLTDASKKAVAELTARGIGFTVTSARPPFGLRGIIAALSLKLPVGAFNGGMIVDPDLNVVEQHLIPVEAAEQALGILGDFKVEPWLYTAEHWIARTLDAPRVAFEQKTIATEPFVTADLAPYAARLGKIVGVSDDFERLERCEAAMQQALGKRASVVRSQRYYLDITPPGVDKGTFVEAIARRAGVDLAAVATLGDMSNDVPMFRRSGVSIAMGNAHDDVQQAAGHVSTSNEDDGFAKAIWQHVLGEDPQV